MVDPWLGEAIADGDIHKSASKSLGIPRTASYLFFVPSSMPRTSTDREYFSHPALNLENEKCDIG